MIKLTNFIKIFLLLFFVSLFFFSKRDFFVIETVRADLLEDAFEDSKSDGSVVDLGGEDAKSVGKSIFKGSTGVLGASDKDSLIVRISKYLLKLTVILGIPAIIIAGIYFILSLGDESKMKKAKNMLIYICIGVLIALGSVALVQLASTITKSTIPSI